MKYKTVSETGLSPICLYCLFVLVSDKNYLHFGFMGL